MTTVIFGAVVFLAAAFAFLNGFRDVSSSVALAVRTRALTPSVAVLLAAFFNFIGALFSASLAVAVSQHWIHLPDGPAGLSILAAGLASAFAWGVLLWWRGIPASSTHALVGGLAGAALASLAVGGTGVGGVDESLLLQVVLPLLLSPLVAYSGSFLLVFPVTWAARHAQPSVVNQRFRRSQSIAAGAVAFGHGLQDGQRVGAHYGGANRHHKPKSFAPVDFEPFAGGADPARVSEAAHLAAQALVRHGRDSDDPAITERLVKLADEQGLEAIAEMWAESPARSLPGALWRLYALRAATVQDPERISVYFRAGKDTAQVSNVVAGAAEPPGAEEMTAMADAILSGAFDGEFDVALERSAAFCRVVALGQATLADGAEHANEAHASKLTRNSHQLVKTAEDLEHAANAWRLGELD